MNLHFPQTGSLILDEPSMFTISNLFELSVNIFEQKIMKEKILDLRSQGKSYEEIRKELNCSKSTISYYCGKDQKEKTLNRNKSFRSKSVLAIKVCEFKSPDKRRNYPQEVFDQPKSFSTSEARAKFGVEPKCYWTGKPIDLNVGSEYQLDHLIPKIKGGLSTLDNLVLSSRNANQAKSDLMPDEFLKLCKEVLENFGYGVTEPTTEKAREGMG